MRRFAIGAVAAILLAAGVLAVLDRADPPDLSHARRASVVVLDRDHTILRAFLAEGGVWRLPTSVSDVDPRYLTLLRAYEDRRFDEHWGVDPWAVLRAAWQWGVTGHIVSGA